MPRIGAATVAEHREQQRRALLHAARAILAETGSVPRMGAVAARAGLARSSVYQYFDSADGLLQAVVADVFPDWAGHVLDKVAAARDPAGRVWAYVEANVDLLVGPEGAVARAVAKVVEPAVLLSPMQEFHLRLQEPVRQALRDLGEPEPDAVAEMIDALIQQSSRATEAGAGQSGSGAGCGRPATGGGQSPDDLRSRALARLRRLLAGYLALSPEPSEAASGHAGPPGDDG